MKPRLVVIGSGLAGMRTLEELLRLAPAHYDIALIGAEPCPAYDRIALSSVLAGDKAAREIVLHEEAWFDRHGITRHLGQPAVTIDRGQRRVLTADGAAFPYERLVLALGAEPVRLDIPGHDLAGVHTFRDLQDVQALIAQARPQARAVVIGGGLLGLEAAQGLLDRGMRVTVVHLMEWLMEQQLDRRAGTLLEASLHARGIEFLTGAVTEALVGTGHVQGVRLRNGRTLPADLVVMAVGIRPRTALARAAGLYSERGIVVSDTLQTFDGRIYAVGECAQHRGVTYGLAAPVFEMARVCANQLALLGTSTYRGSLPSARLKVTGIDLFSAGEFMGDASSDEIVVQDSARGIYKKLVIRGDLLRGVVLYGDIADCGRFFQLLAEEMDIRELRPHLMFGASPAASPGAAQAAAPRLDGMHCVSNTPAPAQTAGALSGARCAGSAP